LQWQVKFGRLAFVADFGTQNFNLKTKFDMENNTSINHENGNDANRLLPAVPSRKPKCYNCKHASSAFKIAGKTHHQCNHPKHEAGFESGELSPWDTLQEFYNTCESHEFRQA
jgi:hypothetical protein